VLYRVSAAQLKAEEMIKLPIMLTEHQNWEEALHDAILTRNKLAEAAGEDKDYIRPITLIQAESSDREVTVEVVKKHLIESENIPPERIAIATGAQRELDGINLFDPECPIEYVITMEALKEGWDCPFAYVFCTVANIHSSKDVEQFLGRVLRMPYAKKRAKEELNRAYAHVSSPGFAQAAKLLHDRLIERMGFDEVEAQAYIQKQEPLFTTRPHTPREPEPLAFTLEEAPDISSLPSDLQERVQVTQEEGGEVKVLVKGEITEEIQESIVQAVSRRERKQVEQIIQTHRYYAQRKLSPSERGETFTVPRLCLHVQGELELVEKDLILDLNSWNLLDYPPLLSEAEFMVRETANTFEIDMKGEKLVYGLVDDSKQMDLAHIRTEWTDNAFVRVLDKELRQPDIRQEVLLEFLRRSVSHLTDTRKIPLSTLVRFKYPLIKTLAEKIKKHRKQAYEEGYQETLFGPTAAVETSFEYAFQFGKDTYAPRWYYTGRYQFQKHFYPVVGELKSSGEEFDCAQVIDALPQVKYWVRNLELQPAHSLWLLTSSDRFYPDFVAELQDGRILVVEYKGDAYVTNDDSKEKKALGELWASKSGGKGLFLMAEKRDPASRDTYTQVSLKVQS
jgi:type III restriction enzyme